MNPNEAYRFCPRCGNALITQDPYLLICSSCAFHLYINPVPATAAIIINEKKQILLVKRKFDPMKGYWDLPGGFMHPNETLEQSVQREVLEELGVPFTMGQIIGVYEDRYVYQGVNNGTICVAVSGTVPSTQTLTANDDITEYRYFSLNTVPFEHIAFRSMGDAIRDFTASPS